MVLDKLNSHRFFLDYALFLHLEYGQYRSELIPGLTRAQIKEKKKKEKTSEDPLKKEPQLLKNSSWAKLLARVFQIDISKCHECGKEMKIISSIKDPQVIPKILTHGGLDPIPPTIHKLG